jgi:hypothetical protein
MNGRWRRAILLDQVEGAEDGLSSRRSALLLDTLQGVRPEHNRPAVDRQALGI